MYGNEEKRDDEGKIERGGIPQADSICAETKLQPQQPDAAFCQGTKGRRDNKPSSNQRSPRQERTKQ